MVVRLSKLLGISVFFCWLTSEALAAPAYRQLPKSEAALLTDKPAAVRGKSLSIGLHVKLDEGWHTYWENPGDTGTKPIFDLSTSDEGLHISDVQWPLPSRFTIPPFTNFGYEGDVLFWRNIAIPEDYPEDKLELSVAIEYLVCEEACLPAYFDKTVSVDVVDAAKDIDQIGEALFARFRERLPHSKLIEGTYRVDGNRIFVTTSAFIDAEDAFVDFFTEESSLVKNDRPVGVAEDGAVTFALNKGSANEGLVKGTLAVFQKSDGQVHGYPLIAKPAPVHSKIGFVLLWAFLGGLLLNLMPCVLPVISIKLLSLVKHSGNSPKEIRFSALIYTAGILVGLLSIALVLVGLREAGEAIGWGFQLQSPAFVALLFYLFVLLGLMFFDVISIDLSRFTGKVAPSHSALSQFGLGLLSVVVATPCTAPFMGAALGFALFQPLPIILTIFIALGLGLAAPYLLFAISPALVRFLPKPGMWMVHLQRFMAFPMWATALWLAAVLESLAGHGATLHLLAVLLLGGAVFYALRSILRLPNWIAAIVFLASLGVAHPVSDDWFVKPATADEAALDESAIAWQPFSPEFVAEQRAAKRAVFVNFTADWCLSCKLNEQVTFFDADTKRFIEENQIVMVKADWTKRDGVIAAELAKFGRVGVPLYVYYAASGQSKVLPEVLTPAIFKASIEDE